MRDRCRVVTTAAGPVRVRGARELTDADVAAIGELQAALTAWWDAMPEAGRAELTARRAELNARQAAARARLGIRLGATS